MQDCVQEYYDTNENEQITQEDFKKKINISKGMGYIDDYNYMLAVSYQIAAVAGCFRDYMLMAPVSKGSYSASNNNLIDVSTTSKLDVAAVASATTKIRNNGAGNVTLGVSNFMLILNQIFLCGSVILTRLMETWKLN